MEPIIKDHVLRFTGTASMADGLWPDYNYEIILNGGCTSAEKKSNEDGTFNMIYKVKLINVVVKDEKGKIIIQKKGKDSPSNRQREKIYALGYSYEDAMARIHEDLEDILRDLFER